MVLRPVPKLSQIGLHLGLCGLCGARLLVGLELLITVLSRNDKLPGPVLASTHILNLTSFP
jgi:hypothetical protein